MKITAITRYKHGELYGALKRAGWTQSELSRRCGCNPNQISRIINLQFRPSGEVANAIQKVLGEAGVYIDVLGEWPESFKGLKRGSIIEQTAEVEFDTLIGNLEALNIPAGVQENKELYEIVGDLVDDLPSRERMVVEDLFFDEITLAESAKKHGLTTTGITAIENRALRKLRHPERLKKLIPLISKYDGNAPLDDFKFESCSTLPTV